MTRIERSLCLVSALQALLFSTGAAAVDAADVVVDDSPMSTIQGTDAQAALESTDAEVTAFVGYHEGVENDADIVYLRQDCTGIKNCFTSMASLAGTAVNLVGGGFPTHPSAETNSSWLWATREPTVADPILIDVGPGTWNSFACPDNTGAGNDFGGITLRGSGRDTTRIDGGAEKAGIDVQSCEDLHFMDMTAVGRVGVRWANGGSATWRDMDMINVPTTYGSYAWFDGCTNEFTPSLHYLFNVRAIAEGPKVGGSPIRIAYSSTCAETWFFGGEIRLGNAGNSDLLDDAAVKVTNGSDFRAFGTPIRVDLSNQVGGSSSSGVVVKGDNAGVKTLFHLHGGIVSMSGSSSTSVVDLTGIDVSDNALAHTPGSAWVVRAPDGTATRVKTSGGAVAQVPFTWQSGTDEPEAGLVSETGQDMFVETDCNASTGVCDGSGTSRPHLMIYDPTCNPSPWFDVVTDACRDPS